MATPPDDYFSDPDFRTLEASFHAYVAQGDGRNIAWLVQKTGLPLTTVARGMVKGCWQQRIQTIGRDAACKTREKLVGDVATMNERDVGRLVELEDEAFETLMNAIRNKDVKPDTLVRIVFGAQRARREALGIGAGAPTNPMQKLLEASVTGPGVVETPFVLDPKKLEAPQDLPTMPGMTSDDVGEDEPRRELDPDEKQALRP